MAYRYSEEKVDGNVSIVIHVVKGKNLTQEEAIAKSAEGGAILDFNFDAPQVPGNWYPLANPSGSMYKGHWFITQPWKQADEAFDLS